MFEEGPYHTQRLSFDRLAHAMASYGPLAHRSPFTTQSCFSYTNFLGLLES